MSKTAKAPRLSRESVVDSALELADREGLEALTIRRLAGEMGVTPMALYWHVKDKDELLQALGERMFAEVRLPERQEQPWHEELSAILAGMLEALRQHPAVAGLALQTVLGSEAALTVAERVLVLLSEAGFDDRASADIGVYLLSSIVTLVTSQPAVMPMMDAQEQERKLRDKQAYLSAVGSERFPTVVRMAEHLVRCEEPEAYFRRGLDLLVLGLRELAPA